MNPIKITLLTLVAWIILTIICAVGIVEDVSEKPFAVMVYAFYLAPFVSIVAFILSSFFYRSWVKCNKLIAILFLAILIVWAIGIIRYIQSLFI